MHTHPPRNELGIQTDVTADNIVVFNLREGWEFGEEASLVITEMLKWHLSSCGSFVRFSGHHKALMKTKTAIKTERVIITVVQQAVSQRWFCTFTR